MNLKISKKISEIRNSNKLTQEDLAEILGVARQTISNWENDKCYPDIETIILISDKFNISLDILLKEDKEMIKKIDKSVRLNKINKKIWMILVILVIVLFFLGYKFYLFNKYNVYSDSDLKFSIQELIVNVDKSIANREFEDMHIFIPEEYTENIDNDYIIFLQDAGSGTTFNNFGHIDTLFHTKFVGLLLQFFGPAFVHLQVCAQITTLDAKERALHGTKLFQVGYHLCHNAGRDGKTIAGISTRG